MIVYQIVQSTAETIAYALDGSKFSNIQVQVTPIQICSCLFARSCLSVRLCESVSPHQGLL